MSAEAVMELVEAPPITTEPEGPGVAALARRQAEEEAAEFIVRQVFERGATFFDG